MSLFVMTRLTTGDLQCQQQCSMVMRKYDVADYLAL